MIVTVNGKEYKIQFSHYKQRKSRCQIVSGEMIIGAGLAVCSPEDQFRRARGRKLALSRAIIEAFPRPERAAFWEAVFTARRNGKKLWGVIDPELLKEPLEKTAAGNAYFVPVEAIEWVDNDRWKV